MKLNSGNRLVMPPRTVLHSRALGRDDQRAMLWIHDVEDVVIEGGILDGAKGAITLGIAIQGARRVRVHGTRAINLDTDKGTKGDGFCIGRSTTGLPKTLAEDIVLDGVTADGNGRQGLSIISVRGLRWRAPRLPTRPRLRRAPASTSSRTSTATPSTTSSSAAGCSQPTKPACSST